MNTPPSDGQGMQADWLDPALHWISLGIEAVGVLAIILGAVVATVGAAVRLARRQDRAETYHLFRTNLARGILLGLEFLVAADIIGTVAVEATVQNLYVLALIVLIRTFLSFSLEVEIEGRWPWQKGRSHPSRSNAHAHDPSSD